MTHSVLDESFSSRRPAAIGRSTGIMLAAIAGIGGLYLMLSPGGQHGTLQKLDSGFLTEAAASRDAHRATDFAPIFSDTAMAPTTYPDMTACHGHMQEIVDTVAKQHRVVARPNREGIFHATFQDTQNNYVLRCFQVDERRYRMFMTGAGTEKFEVSKGLHWFYEAASAAL